MTTLRSYLKSFKTDDTASILIEFALIVPILLLFVVGVSDFSMLQNERMRLATAARAGTQYALANSSDEDLIRQVALAATDLDAAQVTVTVDLTFKCAEDSEHDDHNNNDNNDNNNDGNNNDNNNEFEYSEEDDDHECEQAKKGYVTVTASEQFSTLMDYPWLDNPYQLEGKAKIRLY